MFVYGTAKSSEISDILKQELEGIELGNEKQNEGVILSINDGIIRIYGLSKVMYGELITLPGGSRAIAMNLERDSVGAVVFGEYDHLKEGDRVRSTGRGC